MRGLLLPEGLAAARSPAVPLPGGDQLRSVRPRRRPRRPAGAAPAAPVTYTWVEPFAGAAACALRLVGGPRLRPVISWTGGKRRLARSITEAMGVPRSRPSRVILNDAGPWGWVWPLLLRRESALAVAEVLRAWGGEDRRELWSRLSVRPPVGDPVADAAQWLWLQSNVVRGFPVTHVDGWSVPPGPGAFQMTYPRSATGGAAAVTTAAAVRRVESAFAAARLIVGDSVHVRHGDAAELTRSDWLCGDGSYVYFDPPYLGTLGYGAGIGCSRDDIIDIARSFAAYGAVLAVSEAQPLPIPGWHHVDLTRRRAKQPEWLTLSRPSRLVRPALG